MDFWRVDCTELRYTNAYKVPILEDYCFKYNYRQPLVGYCRVPWSAWCRKKGSFAAHFTLTTTTSTKSFGIVTSFNCFGETVEEAVNKLVEEAIDFIVWRAEQLKVDG